MCNGAPSESPNQQSGSLASCRAVGLCRIRLQTRTRDRTRGDTSSLLGEPAVARALCATIRGWVLQRSTRTGIWLSSFDEQHHPNPTRQLTCCTFGSLSPVHLPRESYELRLISSASVWVERVRERGRIPLDSAPLPDPPPHELADMKQVVHKHLRRQVHGGRERTNHNIRAPRQKRATSKRLT